MKNKTNILRLSTLLLTALFITLPVRSQVLIGENKNPQSFSILEISTVLQKGGLRLPQLTNTERNVLAVSATDVLSRGLIIFNTDTHCIEFWNGTKWVSLCQTSAAPPSPAPPNIFPGDINSNREQSEQDEQGDLDEQGDQSEQDDSDEQVNGRQAK